MIGLAAWYPALTKPAWTPPGWVFAPVWTVLYAFMGIGAYRVWKTGVGRSALTLFWIQLALNGLWSWMFFAWQKPLFASIEVLLLWVFIALTAWAFGKIDRVAGWLYVPYLVWVSFASALTISIWLLNR